MFYCVHLRLTRDIFIISMAVNVYMCVCVCAYSMHLHYRLSKTTDVFGQTSQVEEEEEDEGDVHGTSHDLRGPVSYLDFNLMFCEAM